MVAYFKSMTNAVMLIIIEQNSTLLSMPIDYVVIGFDMEVQPLVTHNAA